MHELTCLSIVQQGQEAAVSTWSQHQQSSPVDSTHYSEMGRDKSRNIVATADRFEACRQDNTLYSLGN